MDRRINSPALALGICSLLIPVVLALGSCWAMQSVDAPRAVVVIAVAETGAQSPLGVPAGMGAALAFASGDGATLFDVQRVDTRSDNAAAAQAAAMAAKGASIAVGFTDSDPALAAAPAFTKRGVPVVVIGATDPALPARCGPGTFLACFGDDAQAIAGAEFGAARFGKRAAVIFDSRRDYTRTLAGFFRTHLGSKLGGSAVAEFDLASVAAPAIAPHLLEMSKDIDFVYVALQPEQVADVLKSVRSALPSTPIVGGDGLDFDGVLQVAGAPASGVFYTTHAWLGQGASPEAAAFAASYAKANAGMQPTAFSALGYDAAMLAVDARRRAGSDAPAAIAAALAATRDFRGVTGTISYANGPVPAKDVWVIEVKAGARALAQRWSPGR